jgi:hypothetical protein
MKKALLIGINYIGMEDQLNGCINDINNVYTMLTNFFNYEPNNIVCLAENLDQKNFPTRNNIIDAVNWLLLNQKDGDTLLLYYSGHGSYTVDRNRDEKDGKDEVIVPLDYRIAGMITDDWLNDNLLEKTLPKVKLYTFFDSCNSGTVIDMKYNLECDSKPLVAPRDLKLIKNYHPMFWSSSYKLTTEFDKNEVADKYCFSACLNVELANETNINNTSQGLFSYFFQEIIRKNLMENNMKCTLKHKDIIKAINANLFTNKFDHQNCMLSACNVEDFEKILDL